VKRRARKVTIKDETEGLGYSSVAECLPSMCKTLGSITIAGKKKYVVLALKELTV
jgi:hypothetical protein